jgi:hypothetical protein
LPPAAAGPSAPESGHDGSPRVLTVVVHGTFAATLRWWRPGGADAPTFADRLEVALARRGMPDTVWKPALALGWSPEAFAWSGRNRHVDRLIGGRTLAIQLNALAETLDATEAEPLVVNFVAHSHGGNVVLEALPRLAPIVRPGRVVLLGTPLLTFRPTLRIVRAAIAALLAFVVVSLFVFVVGSAFVPGLFDWMCSLLGLCTTESGVGMGWLLLLAAAMVLAYGWILVVLSWIVDVAWRVLLFPLTALGKARPGEVYGPPHQRLLELLGGRRLALFTSHQDESDVILELSTAPRRLYAEWVARKWGSEVKILERIALRPVVVGLVLRVAEVVLERYMLGFPWLRVLFFDHEMADLDRGREYPPSLVERVDVSLELRQALEAHPPSVPIWWPVPVPAAERLDGEVRRTVTLREGLRILTRDVFRQVKPVHSEYYESDAVVGKIADAIAGAG